MCGLNQADGDAGTVTVKIKVKQKCCNGSTHYNKTVNVYVDNIASVASIVKKLDTALEEISVSSYDTAPSTPL